MAIEWLAAALLAVKHREDLLQIAQSGFAKVFGRKTSLAFTGMAGVGKSVFLDLMTGKASEEGYELPLVSQGMETGKVGLPDEGFFGKKVLVSVVPGQDSEPRHLALDKLFRTKQKAVGVIHIVGNGFATTRTQGAIQSLIIDYGIDSVEKYRHGQLSAELTDLEKTCEEIRISHQKGRKPRWLIVAVDKVDLFQDSLDQVRRYYSPQSDSKFADTIRALAYRVGTDYFRWEETAPICGCLQPFTWNGTTVPSTITAEARDLYLAQFLMLLKSYCE